MDEGTRFALRRLWLSQGGKTDTIREFYELVRRSGIDANFRDVTRFLNELALPPEVKRRLDALWAERESSAAELLDRAREAEIPVTQQQINKFVREAPERALSAFSATKKTGKAFANSLDDQWQADVIYMTTRPSKAGNDTFSYILYRVNAFSRECNVEPLTSTTASEVTDGLQTLLGRASVKPKTLFTDGGTEFTSWNMTQLLQREHILHEVNEPRDYGSMAVLNAGISALKKLIRLEATDKDKPWAAELPRLVAIRNARPTDQGVRPKDVVPPEDASQEQLHKSAEAQFWLYGANAEAIQHNFADQERKKAALREAGGARLPLDPEKDYGDIERRRGPKTRGDDPKFGPVQRIVKNEEGEYDFSFGRVHMDAGDTTNLKLVKAAKPSGRLPPLSREIVDELEGLRMRVLDAGPTPLKEAARSVAREVGAEAGRYGGAAAILEDLAKSQTGWKIASRNSVQYLLLDGEFSYKGVKYEVSQGLGEPTDLTIREVPGYSAESLRRVKELEHVWVHEGRDDEPWPPSQALERFSKWGEKHLEGQMEEFEREYDQYGEGVDPLKFAFRVDAPRPPERPERPERPEAPEAPRPAGSLREVLETTQTDGGETWATALRRRPLTDFFHQRFRGGERDVEGSMHAELLHFIRALTGRAADEVQAFLGFPPGERIQRKTLPYMTPRLLRLSGKLVKFLHDLVTREG